MADGQPLKPESPGRFWLITTMSLCAIIIAVGAAVMVGWTVQSSALVQIHPTFAPMQFNTALCFFLCGIGLLCLLRHKNKSAGVFGGMAAIIGMLTICQYMFDFSLGIDQLIIDHSIIVKTSHAGRMAPNTALCFLLSGAALVISAMDNSIDRFFPVAILSGAVIALGTVALVGYLVDVETAYGWGSLTRMAIHTSISFIMLGLGLSIWAWKYNDRQKNKTLPSWIPLQLGLVLLTIFLLWQAVSKEESRLLRSAISEQTENVAAVITLELHLRDNTLKRMAERWRHRPNPAEAEWGNDADNYMRDIAGLVGLALIDADHKLIQSRMALSESEPYDFNAQANTTLRSVLSEAATAKSVTYSKAHPLLNDQMIWLTCVPIQHKDGTYGYLVALQKVDELMQNFIQDGRISPDYSLKLLSDREIIFSYAAYGADQNFDISRTIDLDRSNQNWQLIVTPGERIILSYEARLPMVLAVSEIVVIVLAIFSIRLMRQASRQAEELRLANDKLQQTVEERANLEDRFKRSNAAFIRQNEDMEQLLYSVSHDLQAPLVSIAGFTGFLEDDLKAGKLDQVSESIQSIKTALKKMQENLDDLLALSRIGRIESEHAQVSLHELVTQVADNLREQIDEQRVALNIDENLPSIIANPKQMSQLFENVLSNAIKYGCTNQAPRIHVGSERKKDRVLIYIQDNGMGVPRDQQHQIFRLFQRMGTHRDQSGTGLGLSIARRVVDTLAGEIYVDPDYDDGARFVIDLPNTILVNSHDVS